MAAGDDEQQLPGRVEPAEPERAGDGARDDRDREEPERHERDAHDAAQVEVRREREQPHVQRGHERRRGVRVADPDDDRGHDGDEQHDDARGRGLQVGAASGARTTRRTAGRSHTHASTSTSATASSAGACAGSASGATGVPGVAAIEADGAQRDREQRRDDERQRGRRASSAATTRIGSRARRTAASASTATTSGASSSAPTNSRTAQPGSTLRLVTRSALEARALTGRPRGAPSSAVTVRSAARPSCVRRSRETGAPAGGARSPPIDSAIAGSPRASRTPCSP